MNKPKVINLFGGPGCGKSTTAAGLFYQMKVAGIKVELVTEYAKELVYDNTLDIMLDRQEVIFAEQNQRLHRLRNKVEFAIVDSPILLSYIYPEMNQEQKNIAHWPALGAFKQLVVEVFHTYDNLNFFLNRQPDTFEEYGRDHNEHQAISLDDRIQQTLSDLSVPHETIDVGPDTVATILSWSALDKWT